MTAKNWPPVGYDGSVYSQHELRGTWYQMLRRCYWSEHEQYHDYGGRGIEVDLELRCLGNYISLISSELGEKPGAAFTVDRIDNDGPYTISNMRWASRSEQNANQGLRVCGGYPVGDSGFRGVSYHNVTGRWRVRIRVGKQEKSLGYYDTSEEAARAYDRGARLHHGAAAVLNFPELQI